MKAKRVALFLALVTLFMLFVACNKGGGETAKSTDPGTEFLPIGTIVNVEGTTKKIVVLGYAAVQIDAEEFVQWDYSGAVYPQGVLDPEEMYLLNHDMITSVVHWGYEDEEFTKFLPLIYEAMEEENTTQSL